MTIAIVAIAVLILLAFWLFFLATSRDNRVFSREPSEFELAARRFSESMQEMQRAFAVALMPAFTETAHAISRWNESWAGVIKELEAKHGPRPEGIPFLDWAAAVERTKKRNRPSRD